MQIIRFYRLDEAYGSFSNFAPFPIELHGKVWPTSEHYFQAQKFAGTEHEEAIRCATSPTIAARMGRSRSRPLRPDWEAVKDAIMREAVQAKFAQHSELAALLLRTGDALLVEHSRKDRYWGDGGDGSGRNVLGQILMQVRAGLLESGGTEQHYPEPTVGALILDPAGRLLLVRSHKWRDRYTVPGGHVELGERLIEALVREVKEETGLDVYAPELLCVQEFVYDDGFWKRRHYIFFDYACRTDSTAVQLNDEAEECVWVRPEEAHDLPLEKYAVVAVKEYLRRHGPASGDDLPPAQPATGAMD